MPTERELLHLVRCIALLKRRASRVDCYKLAKAIDAAGYYAGLMLGKKIMEVREPLTVGDKAIRSCMIYGHGTIRISDD